MRQMTLPIPPAPVSEAELRAAWHAVPGRADHEYERFAREPAVRRCLEAMVRCSRRRQRRRRKH